MKDNNLARHVENVRVLPFNTAIILKLLQCVLALYKYSYSEKPFNALIYVRL